MSIDATISDLLSGCGKGLVPDHGIRGVVRTVAVVVAHDRVNIGLVRDLRLTTARSRACCRRRRRR